MEGMIELLINVIPYARDFYLNLKVDELSYVRLICAH